MARTRQILWIEAALALALLVVMLPGTSRAQEGAKPPGTPATQSQAQPEQPSPSHEGQKELENGGEADAIRHSPSVKWIARHTGLTDDQAYWVCLGLNFAVIFFFMANLMRKKLPGYFGGRTSA
ncbi:MAG TPA: hypothetical protein VNB54_12870, partial [Alphaproteobacteria bacterium]|nr:hypothetical protein [Alphaproteobacteria bacterium]